MKNEKMRWKFRRNFYFIRAPQKRVPGGCVFCGIYAVFADERGARPYGVSCFCFYLAPSVGGGGHIHPVRAWISSVSLGLYEVWRQAPKMRHYTYCRFVTLPHSHPCLNMRQRWTDVCGIGARGRRLRVDCVIFYGNVKIPARAIRCPSR